MALDIIDGAVTPITGLTWNGKQVFHYQNLIPAILSGQTFDLGIGSGREITKINASGIVYGEYKIGVNRIGPDSYNLVAEGASNLVSISGNYELLSSTSTSLQTGTFSLTNGQNQIISQFEDGSTTSLTNLVLIYNNDGTNVTVNLSDVLLPTAAYGFTQFENLLRVPIGDTEFYKSSDNIYITYGGLIRSIQEEDLQPFYIVIQFTRI